jgi:hypothetical protein
MSVPRPHTVSTASSDALRSFAANCEDIRSYYAIHQHLKDTPSIRRHLRVIDKGAFVLVTAMWETYCEDAITEALDLLSKRASSPADLPLLLRKQLAKEMRSASHELAPWDLAGDGWRQLVARRLEAYTTKRNRNFNTPRANNVRDLFRETLGIEDITQDWVSARLDVAEIRRKLDHQITVRGEIAHRASSLSDVTKKDVKVFIGLVFDLVESIDATVGWLLFETVGVIGWRD